MLDLSDPDAYANGVPHEVFRELRATAPVSRQLDKLGKHFWAVTRYHDIVAVLRDPATFSSAKGGVLFDDPPPEFLARLQENMLNRDPPEHTSMRKLVNKAFSPKRLAELETRIAAHAVELVARARGHAVIDFATDVAGDMPLFVICEILGVPLSERAWLYGLTERMFSSGQKDRQAAQADGIAAAMEMRAYAAKLGAKRIACPQDDLVSELLTATVDDAPLSPGEFQAFFMLLFNAGSDTTRGLLCMALDTLTQRRDLWELLAGSSEKLPAAVEEILRLEPPVIHFRRTATIDTTLAGAEIFAGDRVVVFFPSANRDETVFESPDDLDLDRKRIPHLAFGYGTHFCLGAPLARMESKHVLGEVFRQWSGVARVEPPEFARSAMFRSVRHQKLAIQHR